MSVPPWPAFNPPIFFPQRAYRGLVEEDDLAVADEGDRDGQTPLLAAGEALGLAVAELGQRNARERIVDGEALVLLAHALEACVEQEVVLHRQVRPQDVVLRAHA